VPFRGGSKYKAKKYSIDGRTFHSRAEAAYYLFTLKPRLEAGEISHLEFQPVIKCIVNGELICRYTGDFRFIDPNQRGPMDQAGASVLIEVKGYETPEYKLKMKLVKALNPGLVVQVIPASSLRSAASALPPAMS
jgi:hypothetical protein